VQEALKPKTARTLDVEDITVRYGQATAVDGVTLAIEPGEVVALLGPSGCGKSTLLRVIAGFVRQVEGRVRVDGASIDHLPPNQRNIGIVFQNYALFPHMTVAENVAYGLRARGARGPEVAAKVNRFLETVQLAGFRDRLPRQLSGGQQQRVALARALAVEPSILLLDEPFAALDRNLRLDMQIEVKRLQRQLGLTTILVTHDQDEAMSVADRIAVMNKGKVEQFDSPVAIYDKPQTLFVNGFIGTTNLLGGKIASVEGSTASVALDSGAMVRLPASGLTAGTAVLLSVRPEHLVLSAVPGPGLWKVEPGLSLPLGSQLVHEARTADGVALKIVEPRLAAPVPPGRLYCGLTADARPSLFPRST
jgi:putative spermidine/putrescine transport system ATP-binding protein